MEVSSGSGFWQFHLEGVAGGPQASCRYLGDSAQRRQWVQDQKGSERGHSGCKIDLLVMAK